MKDRTKKMVINILRVIITCCVLMWGIKLWNKFPEEIPLHFDASMKPDEYGIKKKLVGIFIIPLIALLPIHGERLEDESKSEEELKKLQEEEDRKGLILAWAHTLVMCFIFIVILFLIQKNLR